MQTLFTHWFLQCNLKNDFFTLKISFERYLGY